MSPVLPPELQSACEQVGLEVRSMPFEGDGAILAGRMLLHSDRWSPERLEWTVRQSLAELGVPGFEGIPVEPFGQAPAAEA